MSVVARTAALVAVEMVIGCAGPAGTGVTGSTRAEACGSCHVTEYGDWKGSRLPSSGTSPVFTALAAKATASWGEAAGKRCTSCHEPGFGGDHGIGCVACHSATGNLATRDGLLLVDTTQPISGPFADPLPTYAHGSREYGFLTSPLLCGTCHEVTGPGLFVEPTLDEFEASPAAATASCGTCHMPDLPPAAIATGEKNARPRKGHAFVGMDPPWGADAGEAEAASLRTLSLLEEALRLDVVPKGRGFSVRLTNLAGHAVPTGPAFLRRLWVNVQMSDASGSEETRFAILDLSAQPTRQGKPVPLITDADDVVSQVLPPGASRSVDVEPDDTLAAPITAVATLRAVAVRSEVLEALGLAEKASEVPTHVVATRSVRGSGG